MGRAFSVPLGLRASLARSARLAALRPRDGLRSWIARSARQAPLERPGEGTTPLLEVGDPLLADPDHISDGRRAGLVGRLARGRPPGTRPGPRATSESVRHGEGHPPLVGEPLIEGPRAC